MTGSLHATYTHKEHELAFRWRAITPTEECSNSPQWAGVWADWMSLESATLSRYHQWIIGGSLSFGHFGNKGIRNFQTSLHKNLNCHYSWLTYEDQRKSLEVGGTALAGYILSQSRHIYTEITIEYADDPALREYGAAFLMNYQATKDFRISLQTKSRRILGSRLYTSPINTLKKNRYEATLSFQFHSWRPSIKYLSPYLSRDIKRQINVDLFNTSF
ncbi:MAG: hypothetical protein AB8C84_02980 [Oligoflexales bacterium]